MKCLLALLMLNVLLLQSGCTIGPKTERKVILVHPYDAAGNPVVVGTVDESVKVKVRYITKRGDEFVNELDIGGWDVSPRPIPKPEPAAEVVDLK